jgi:hypothetical protein
MKKLFLLIAFTGIVGAASASSLVAFNKATVITNGGDEKKDEKKKCDKDKACCKKGEKSGKACSGEKGKCCHAKEASTSTTPATTTPEKK